MSVMCCLSCEVITDKSSFDILEGSNIGAFAVSAKAAKFAEPFGHLTGIAEAKSGAQSILTGY